MWIVPDYHSNLEVLDDGGAGYKFLGRWKLSNRVHCWTVFLDVIWPVRQALLVLSALCAALQEIYSLHGKASWCLHLHPFAVQRLGDVGVAISHSNVRIRLVVVRRGYAAAPLVCILRCVGHTGT